MVHELRKRDGIRELSLVAEANRQLVGHIICSNARIETPDGKSTSVLNFGPISVLPQYQQKGVGKALMYAMIDKAKGKGYGAIMFFGRPEYYPQFGFVEAAEYGVTDFLLKYDDYQERWEEFSGIHGHGTDERIPC